MSDDAAQDKKTEDDSIAEADVQGSADITPPATPEAEPVDAAAAEPAAAVEKPDLTKGTDAPAPAAAEAKPAAAASGAAEGKSSTLKSASLPLIAAFAAGVLLVAAIGAVVFFWLQSDKRENELADRDDATKAACDFVKTVSVYDEKSLGDYVQRVQASTTGEFRQMFDTMSGDLKDVLTSVHASSKLNTVRCGWESGDDSKATVLVSLTQTSSNTMRAQPLVLTLPTFAELEKKDGKWLVSKFEPIADNGNNGLFPGGGTPNPSTQPAPTTPGAPAPAPAPGN
ncbi:hypothetical protein OHB26_11595 [Nocardia sp. NBC_01503]|uniref:hypothetical protein n=1 Tax=Nocardia sp. NBC_01503 TaxID=2975997 RepID=UPI002E7B2E9F|nr:hypothetical protein [Nocardia sp. NBC_01503]WTL34776.1 hypothetical protein OHB26_11595 [Nocardia sp. NBC_01503]